MLFRSRKSFVEGIFLGFCFACGLLLLTNYAIPARPLGVNISHLISFELKVSDWNVTGSPDNSPESKSLEENGVIFSFHGGLGNQLFQYACSYALSRDHRLPLFNLIPNSSSLSTRRFLRDNRDFALDKFHVPWTNMIQKSSINTSAVTYINDSQLFFRTYPRDRTLLQLTRKAYCMGYVYWAQYKKDIVAMFQLKPEVVQGFSPYVIKLRKDIENSEDSVAVHVRRGDFRRYSSWVIPISYQRDSMTRISNMLAQRQRAHNSSRQTRPKFFIFSDDIEYCKKELNNETKIHDLIFVSSSGTGINTTSLEEFFLMMKCKHFIIPNSTFSWWAAFLATHKENNGSSSNSDSIVIASKHNPGYWKKYRTDTKKMNFYRNVIEEFGYFPLEWIVHTPGD